MSTFDQRQRIAQQQEQVLLATLINSPARHFELPAGFMPEHFESAAHQTIMGELNKFQAKNQKLDFLVLEQHLLENSLIHAAGGENYLLHLAGITQESSSVKFYAEQVMKRYKQRQAADIALDLQQRLNGSTEPEVLIESAAQALMDIGLERSHSSVEAFSVVADTFRDKLFKIATMSEQERLTATQGMSTGFPDLDKLLNGGLKPGHMVVVAARPAMGKSLLALNMVRSIARNNPDSPVMFFSLEMTKDSDLAPRLLSDLLSIPLKHLLSARLTPEDVAKWNSGIQRAKSLNIHLDDKTNTIEGIRIECRKLAAKHKGKLSAVFIDYMQLMKATVSAGRFEDITNLSIELKTLAKTLGCPVVAISQLSRKCEERGKNKRPIPSDLKESGQIEQDADVIMLLYRDDVYARQEGRKSQAAGVCEINIAKNRHGETGVVLTHFNGAYQRLEPIDPHFYGDHDD